VIRDESAPAANRIALVQAFAEAGNREVVPAILQIFNGRANAVVRQGILMHAARFDEPALPTAVLKGYEARFSQTAPLRDAAHRMLVSRREWAKLFLAEVEKSEIKPREVSSEVVGQLRLHQDADIDRLVRKLWPAAGLKLSSAEKAAEAERIRRVLSAPGDAGRGREIFTLRCSTCHTLFDAGGSIGPNLTGYDRSNTDFWLRAILEPSAEIREGYGAYVVKLKDGRTLLGTMSQQDAGTVVLQDLAGQKHTARAAEVEKVEALPQSLMPESLLNGLDDGALRDLFAYLAKP
jgi:putative heme-binding domain-containing protein